MNKKMNKKIKFVGGPRDGEIKDHPGKQILEIHTPVVLEGLIQAYHVYVRGAEGVIPEIENFVYSGVVRVEVT